ncbi:MAG: hypothetical protein K2K30_07685 [Alistipes sp.]|nr:hypothetical protein [Alistipes sp.]
MKREIINTDESGNLILPADMNEIAMTEYEIAALFGVIVPTVRAAIKAVYRSGVIREGDAKRCLRRENGNVIEVYSVEAVVALAFRVDSFGAHKLREHLFHTLRMNGRRSAVHILLTCSRIAEAIPPN